jgi:hypothetical protein
MLTGIKERECGRYQEKRKSGEKIMLFRKKPIVVEAVRLKKQTEIKTLEGTMVGNKGDWLITGVNGENTHVNRTYSGKHTRR